MSNIIIPGQQQPEFKNVCVIVHRKTGYILTFCFDDPFARKFEGPEWELKHLYTARDIDKYSAIAREQATARNQKDDELYQQRMDAARKKLRDELISARDKAQDGFERRRIDAALNSLDRIRQSKQRIRDESHLLCEELEQHKIKGEEIAKKIICNE